MAKEGTLARMAMDTGVLLLLAFSGAIASGACGGRKIIRDQGLRRAWAIEPDARHPERPGRLVEIPWSVESNHTCVPSAPGMSGLTSRPAPEVRAGMRVTVWRLGESGEIRLRGTALGEGRRGEAVGVRAGLGGATLEGIVRGPGVVELSPRKTGE